MSKARILDRTCPTCGGDGPDQIIQTDEGPDAVCGDEWHDRFLCPCRSELDVDCECFGIYRLAKAQENRRLEAKGIRP